MSGLDKIIERSINKVHDDQTDETSPQVKSPHIPSSLWRFFGFVPLFGHHKQP